MRKSATDEGSASAEATPHPSSMLRISATLSHKGRGEESTSHRRRNPVAADIDAVGFQHAVLFLGGAEDVDFGARLQFGFVADDEGNDRRIPRHHDVLFAVIVPDQ